jgi:arylsulfatase A-like enzyme
VPPEAGTNFAGAAVDWDLPTRYHNSVWTAERTVRFLETRAADQPFCLGVGFQDPHHPHCLPRDFPDRVDPQAVPLPRWREGELADKPPHFARAHDGTIHDSEFRGEYTVAGTAAIEVEALTEAQVRWGRAYYYSMVRLIDREVGRILDALDRLGLAENTLVVFTTDHGELLGDHGLWLKGPYHYDELVRIPFLVRWPAGFAGGQAPTALASQVDIVPTALAAAGLPGGEALDGCSLLPLLRGDASAAGGEALVECVDDPRGLRLKTLVTPDRKLTWYAGHDFGELYDLEADPDEQVNRWADPAWAPERARLLGRLLSRLERVERRQHRYCYA